MHKVIAGIQLGNRCKLLWTVKAHDREPKASITMVLLLLIIESKFVLFPLEKKKNLSVYKYKNRGAHMRWFHWPSTDGRGLWCKQRRKK